ncbi:MAG: Nudix family hydrolase [Nevskiales bacterium]
MRPTTPLHIAVGVVEDKAGRVLISQRKPDCSYAGQWEFPGGKVESGEAVEDALRRELREELGVEVTVARPLIRVAHRYPDREVLLDTWRVKQWSGVAQSREGQCFAWVKPDEISNYPLLAANHPITNAVRLPECYLITPDPEAVGDFLGELKVSLDAGMKMFRLRAATLGDTAYLALAKQCIELAKRAGAQILVDRCAEQIETLGAQGLHLRATDLWRFANRPLPARLWLAASCHSADELGQALAIGADFAVLGPVSATPSHASVTPLGWQNFAAIKDTWPLPVYALGGLGIGDLASAWQHGAQGIAAVRGLWRKSSPTS